VADLACGLEARVTGSADDFPMRCNTKTNSLSVPLNETVTQQDEAQQGYETQQGC
jgi:hypothetical protein